MPESSRERHSSPSVDVHGNSGDVTIGSRQPELRENITNYENCILGLTQYYCPREKFLVPLENEPLDLITSRTCSARHATIRSDNVQLKLSETPKIPGYVHLLNRSGKCPMPRRNMRPSVDSALTNTAMNVRLCAVDVFISLRVT